MLKKSAIKRIITSSIALLIMISICSLPTLDNIKNNNTVNNKNNLKIFVLNHDNLLSEVTVNTEENIFNIPYIINLLTIDKDNINLPNGFSGVINKNIKLNSYIIDNKILTLDFSKELLENDINKVIEALAYTFINDYIHGITININNKNINEYEKYNYIPSIITKDIGINKLYDINNFKNITHTTIYYLSKENENIYYTPITKITNEKDEKIEIIINELKKVPYYGSNLISYLNASYELKDYELTENEINLSLNIQDVSSLVDTNIIEEVTYMISQSIKDTYQIDNVNITIN